MNIGRDSYPSLGQPATKSQQKGYRIEALNQLAFHKGGIPKCDLSGQPATVACITSNITLYYASEEQAEQAWHGIMHKISPLIGSLRATPRIIGTEEERARREYTIQMSKKALIDLCQQEASKFLVKGRYDLAVPGAIQALTFSKEVFGQGSIEMVPPYLILSEANLGLGLLHNAEQFLSMANWSILKTPHCSNSLRSQLHRNFGKLLTAQNKMDEAIGAFSKDIYCSSLEVGPEHIDSSAGYFLVANIFYAQRKVESALAFYDKVVDIWYKFLASARSDTSLVKNINEAQISEGMDMLTRVLDTRVNLLGDTHIATGKHHASTQDVAALLAQLGESPPQSIGSKRSDACVNDGAFSPSPLTAGNEKKVQANVTANGEEGARGKSEEGQTLGANGAKQGWIHELGSIVTELVSVDPGNPIKPHVTQS